MCSNGFAIRVTAPVACAAAMAEPTAPKPRLVIKEMVLDNFKSYAGPQTIGPFHKARPPQLSPGDRNAAVTKMLRARG